MQDQDPGSTRFKFSPDDDIESSSLLEEPSDELELDRVRRRINRMALLLPLLLIVALAGIYWALNQQVNRSRDTGSIEVLRLSKDLEASFSALSVKQARLDEILDKQLGPMNERLASHAEAIKEFKGGLQNLEKAIAEVGKSKLGPQDLEKSSAALTAKISGLAQEIKRFTEKMEGAGASTADQIKEMGATLDQTVLELADMAVALDAAKGRLTQLQNQIAQVQSSQISQERLDTALKDIQLNLRDNDNITLLVSEQAILEKRINGLEDQLKALQNQLTRSAPRTSPAPSPPATIPSPSGGFQEQTIN